MKRNILGLVAIVCVTSCLGSLEREDDHEAPPAIIAVRPNQDVLPEAAIAIAVEPQVMLAVDAWPIRVSHEDGREVPARGTLGAGGFEIRISPQDVWPAGERLTIELGPGFVDAVGQPLVLPTEPLTFTTRAVIDRPRELSLRMPSPGRLSPINLRTFSFVVSPPPRDLHEVELVGTDGSRITSSVERSTSAGVLFARLPALDGPCRPLCPSSRYRLEVSPLFEEELGADTSARREIVTSTVVDTIPPVITATSVLVHGDRIVVQVEASEPVVLEGSIFSEHVVPMPLVLPLVADTCVFVEATEPLFPATSYEFRIEGEDIAGNRLPAFSVRARTPPNISAFISEIVPQPRHDWGDSEGGGIAFDPYPGVGTVSDADEWIELVNQSASAIDLKTSGLFVRTIDTSPSETSLEGPPAFHFGDGGSPRAWWPGEALVVRLRGSMAQRGFVLELVSGTRLLDRVVVGDAPDAIARAASPPDLAHESLARDIRGEFRWCVPTPGDPLPVRECL